MTQVSKRLLQPEILEKVLDIFLTSFLKMKNKDVTKQFFEEFLSTTEKTMLAKRITCMYLIYKKIPMKEIDETLKISSATIAKYSLLLQRSSVINKILEEFLQKENFIKIIDTFIHEYLSPPTKYGTDWKTGWKLHKKYLQRKHSPL